MAEILAFENVSIEYTGKAGSQAIIRDVSFAIAQGESLGLVGESSCGKSTMALAAMRYLPLGMRLSAGRILVEGRDTAGMTDRQLSSIRGNRVAMIYQDPMSSLNPVMTVGEQLMEVPMLHGAAGRADAHKRAVAMLGEVRLADPELMMTRYPHQLSGGQQQRVVIAMALMAETALLIMDEPTTGLDVTIEAAILELVRELRSKFGVAILFISHNLGTVARICDRIGVLYAGRLVETGPIRAVFRRPAHPYTHGLLAALPRLDAAGKGGRLRPIDGTLTAADRARAGCAFSTRCPHVVPALCVEKPIALAAAGEETGHMARCARLAAVAAAARAETVGEAPPLADPEAPVLLEVKSLTKHYELGGRFGGPKRVVRALSEASFQARAGQTLAIVGESGCGKSTLAKTVAGLIAATGGEARLGAADLAKIPVDKRPRDLRRRIQMVFQNPDSTLNPSHSVEFALARPLKVLLGMKAADAGRQVARLMDQVQLPAELARRMPHQLSGGQRQRVAIARALAGQPDLVVADEPVSALDVSVQAAILNLLSDLLRDSQIGLVVISHDLALVRHMADWVAVMYLGRVVEYGPADAVFAPPHHPYTEALLAAAPKPDPDEGPPEVVLGGVMPSPTQAIAGCPFASRCPRKLGPVCDGEPPPLRRFGAHAVACHIDLPPPAALVPPQPSSSRKGIERGAARP
jgi:peptide/nickel transport system ATP-binding protein